MVLADSLLACIRCASTAFDASKACGRSGVGRPEHNRIMSKHCARCLKLLPEGDTDWEVLTDADGEVVGVICEDCITPEEQQATDEDEMAVGEQMYYEGRVLVGHCSRCFRSVPYQSDDPSESLPHGWGVLDHNADVLLVVCPDCISPDDELVWDETQ
jgi:hypothetical protein